MLPPSNSRNNPLLQYLEKLAAVTHRPRHLPPSTRPAPPLYTASFSSQDSEQDWDEDYDYDEDYDEYYEAKAEHRADSNSTTSSIRAPAANSNTLTIDLNSSIQIKGDANTIIITSDSVHQQHASYQGTSTRNLRPERPSAGAAAAPAISSKLANTTSAIVAALQKSGVLSGPGSGPGSSAAPSVNINIDAGIRVDGIQNVVCFGAGSLPLAKRYHDAAGRKRRAQSVCSMFVSYVVDLALTLCFFIQEPLTGGEEKRNRVI
jgi:hypothetical protein